MKLNHVNLTVDDVTAARQVLEQHFGLRPLAEPHLNFAVLRDEAGLILTLMGAGRAKPVAYPPTFHIGFDQPSEGAVREVWERLTAAGFEIDPPRRESHAFTFYFKAPGGFTVEVMSA